jgi:threonylcarbamoyladenosine tRNA methylthiotransferase MtaB
MKILLTSIGCRTNQEEVVTLQGALVRTGFKPVGDLKDAEVVIVNTCSVTSRTEAKARRLLRAIAREAPDARIMVTGCLAQQKGAELFSECGTVAWVVGNARKHDIPAILREGKEGVYFGELKRAPLRLPQDIVPPLSCGRTRFYLKIQEGCDNACAYCIVPFLRGPSRSARYKGIVETFTRVLGAGYKEIVLTGTHIGRFRGDKGEGRLLSLVKRLARIEGDFRMRLSSLDPAELSHELLALAGEGGKLCDHLHLSLQSLSAEVLSRMHRPNHDLERTIELLADFRGRFPHAGLGADFIVGFPGETDAMFEATLRNAEKIGFSYAHIFRFSARPGTAAAAMTPKIPEAVKRFRSERLRAVIERSRLKFIESQQGAAVRIIVEQERPVRGITSNYLGVELHSGVSAIPNTWLDVVIEEGQGSGRFCRAKPYSKK